MRQRSVILLSGGLDSAANLALCAERDEPVLALTCDYGQRAALSELKAAHELSVYYGVRHESVNLSWLGNLGGSSLTQAEQSVPQVLASQLDDLVITQKQRDRFGSLTEMGFSSKLRLLMLNAWERPRF